MAAVLAQRTGGFLQTKSDARNILRHYSGIVRDHAGSSDEMRSRMSDDTPRTNADH
jgi:hypothetical protein